MKIPQSPPPIELLLKEKIAPHRTWELLEKGRLTDKRGYLHWDEMRFRKPPSDLSLEEWWLITSIARRNSAQPLPFKNKQGKTFFYNEPPELKALMRYVDMHAGGILGGSRDIMGQEDASNYMRRSLVEEPFLSSLIEGAVTTRDIAKKMILENRKPKTRDERMVINNYNGMMFVKDIRHEDLTPAYVLELHRIMTEGTLDNPKKAGKLRDKNDDIAVVDDTKILHMPPDADTLPERMEALCRFANETDNNDTYFCHPLIRAMMLHFMLSYDHPFVDGNGRTARALFYWMLLKEGYWIMEYTSISGAIAQAPAKYYRAFLYTETDSGDLTYFFLHQARTTRQALERMHEYAEKKRKEFERFHEIVNEQKTGTPLNERQTSLIQNFVLGREKTMEVGIHQKRFGVSYLTARKDLEDLVERKLVRKTKKGRSSIYRPVTGLPEKLPIS